MSSFNSTDSLENLVKSHIPIVKSNARKIFFTIPKGFVEEEDLVSEGLCALVSAAKTYDPDKFDTFANYVKIKTRGAMLDYLRKQDILSQQKRKEVKDFKKNVSELESNLNRAATEAEILENLNLNPNQYAEILQNINASSMVYIDTYEKDFLDTLTFSSDDSSNNMSALVSSALSKLSEREQLLFQLYFYEDFNFKEIATTLDISAARVSQIYSKAILKLQAYIKEELNKEE